MNFSRREAKAPGAPRPPRSTLLPPRPPAGLPVNTNAVDYFFIFANDCNVQICKSTFQQRYPSGPISNLQDLFPAKLCACGMTCYIVAQKAANVIVLPAVLPLLGAMLDARVPLRLPLAPRWVPLAWPLAFPPENPPRWAGGG